MTKPISNSGLTPEAYWAKVAAQPPKKKRKKRAKPEKCRCGHLAKNHHEKGRCLMQRSTPGGRVYRCDCDQLRPLFRITH